MHRINEAKAASERKIQRSTAITVICDLILLAVFVACLLIYISGNRTTTYNQNVKSITNIAESSSHLMEAALENTSLEVKSAYKYCDGLTEREILDYLARICPEDEEYQLLKRNADSTEFYHVYSGYSTKQKDGEYVSVLYEDTSLPESLYLYSTEANGTVFFSQSFTNNSDALRYFAVFCQLSVKTEDGYRTYYIVKPQRENRVLRLAQTSSQYANMSFAVCYIDGNYLANDNGFRSGNFYDYLYKYNDLSLDERNEIVSSVANNADGFGSLSFKDYQGRDCVFAYATCGGNANLMVVVAVPTSEFVTQKLLSAFPLIIIGFLAILLFFNIYRLMGIVKELRQSVERERIANLSKRSFLSRMSHEIRTPLNAVIGYNTIARNEMSASKDAADIRHVEMKVMDYMEKSEVASKHLLAIINDVLDMSAIESGKIKIVHERFDFKELINSLTTVFYSQARAKNVNFEVLFNSLTEEWFIGDQMRTSQILTNLLSNAIKFTPEGGTVVMKIDQPEAATNASHLHFEVSDTGIGMTAEYLSHIWTPFEQADSSISRRFGGTGLGLSITKTLVELMGGTIAVQSKPGIGTRFDVDLTFEIAEPAVDLDVYNFDTVNALAVDDDIDTCNYIKLLFNRCGARCTAVTSGEKAIKLVSDAIDNNEPYSVCLVDWRMPKMDGIDTIKEIRKIAGDKLPIIVLTAYDYSEISDKAREIGVTKFISKPLFQSSLFDFLANISKNKIKPIEQSKQFDFNGLRVLLAEDNVMNMDIATKILSSAGLLVDNAWNGKEAVELFEKSETDTYTAILMDVHMPEMDGLEATRTIRASSRPDAKTIPIIAMTADAFAENVAEAKEAGMNDHIAKPIDITLLFETLKQYVK